MRKRNALWTVVGLATVAATSNLMWRASDLGRASADLGHQRAAARNEGVPIDWDDVRRLDPPVAADDNAAVLYERGFAQLKDERKRGEFASRLLDDLPAGRAKPDDVAALRADLAAQSKGLATIVAGTRRKGYSFARAWESGAFLRFPEFSDARTAARALVLRAMLASDPAAARDDLIAVARLRANVGSEPLIFSPVVGANLEAMVEKGIRAMGRKGGVWIGAARATLAALGPLPDLRRALAFEAVGSRQFALGFAKTDLGMIAAIGAGGRDPSSSVLRFASFGPVRDALEARAIAYWRGVYAALPTDPRDFRETRRAVRFPLPSGPSGAIVRIAAPELKGAGDLAASMEADRRLTREALALWSGGTPLAERDPFGQGPLRLRRHGSGWTLYSVGPDGVDDGGLRRKGSTDRRYDLVVEG